MRPRPGHDVVLCCVTLGLVVCPPKVHASVWRGKTVLGTAVVVSDTRWLFSDTRVFSIGCLLCTSARFFCFGFFVGLEELKVVPMRGRALHPSCCCRRDTLTVCCSFPHETSKPHRLVSRSPPALSSLRAPLCTKGRVSGGPRTGTTSHRLLLLGEVLPCHGHGTG